jgi:UDP-glucose 4-epimerase
MRDSTAVNRVAIMGADGFIGRHLSRYLTARPRIELVLIGRSFVDDYLTRQCPRARIVRADMTSTQAAAACSGAQVVVDLAGAESPRSLAGSGLDEVEKTAASHTGFYRRLGDCDVGHVVVLSSGGTVYGPTDAAVIAEDHPTRPRSGYGIAKLMVEEGLDAAARSGRFHHTILRPANCYGPGQVVKRRQGLIAAILDCYQSGRSLKVAGDGTIVRDFVFVDDLVTAIAATIDIALGNGDRLSGERINIGCGRGTSILEMIDMCAAITGRRLSVEFGPAHDFDVPRNVLDIGKAKRLLGWSPQVPLEPGLERLLRDLQHA